MATLPEYLSRHRCERPDLKLVAENEKFRHFFCATCKEDWIISRSKVKAEAREDLFMQRVREATPREKRMVFGRYYGGARHD